MSQGVPTRFTKIRVGFSYLKADRPVAWFLPQGNDLYWGPSSPGKFGGSESIAGQSFTVTVPDDIDRQAKTRSKFSYHASGQSHHKLDGQMEGGPGRLQIPESVSEPFVLSALISKPAKNYAVGRSLTSKGAHALRLHVDDDAARRRHYFEFLISPVGTFPTRPLLISPAAPAPVYTASISPRLILVVRHAICGDDEFADWQPEVEMWINHINDPTAGPPPGGQHSSHP